MLSDFIFLTLDFRFFMSHLFRHIDRFMIDHMGKWGITYLRIALGLVFFWFGILKLIGKSPVVELLTETWTFIPTPAFVFALGILEVLIGIGLMLKFQLRVVLALLWFQLLGTFITLGLTPTLFFVNNNPLLLTMEGEFIMKNLVLFASGIVIGGYEVEE